MNKQLKVIISGGGTGGHIFPAIAIANELKARAENMPKKSGSQNLGVEILFIGAEGRMEMERVPQAGYEIRGLKVMGIDRKHLWRNAKVIYNYIRSKREAAKIIKEFAPDVAIGVGGYASGPAIGAAEDLKVPVLLQEQNSYAGVTNKMLSKRAATICVAYEGMEKFFPEGRIVLTGNPVRQELTVNTLTRELACRALGLNPAKRTVLIVGGSLGARTLNESVLLHLDLIRKQRDVQFYWQTGKLYSQEIKDALDEKIKPDNLHVSDFIADMAKAYKAADLVISRAGACSISELQLLGKPAILVPSPNVAEDHQTKNAMALVSKKAAICVRDAEARMALLPRAIGVVNDAAQLTALSQNIAKMGKPNATRQIVDEILKLAKN
ncbi:MAG: undecaprenyldiphospho-muramoylpentapeptide beta-N-acetylglucosaminyltransferase [Bacteroidaceae bacterium]|nr:undecaprenyldiphospho-muramoylpentapeptide beta-N-acetylglucosaminyltransferase [Bacteroidaceae bacterium]MBR4782985.1 undecaprenyldiphospho-muramoylpentapeptide beta-N-acetylglucosaminyltransferase [Bacteroidaceae bacterium]